MLAAVALVDVLQHLLAITVREVDVDVGRLVAIVAQKSFEEEIELDRVDGGDADAKAHRGVGGRAAPLTEHAGAIGEAHYIPHDQKVAGEAESLDECELVRELRALACVDGSPALGRALGDEALEIFVGADAGRERECGERRMQIVQAECAALGDGESCFHTIRMMTPALHHPRGTLQPPLGVGAEARAHLVERALVAERGEHVVHDAAGAARVVDVVGDDPRHVQRARDLDEWREERALFFQAMIPALDGEATIEDLVQTRGGLARACDIAGAESARDEPARATSQREQTLRVRGDGA